MDDVVTDLHRTVDDLELELLLLYEMVDSPVDQHRVGLDDVHLNTEALSSGFYKHQIITWLSAAPSKANIILFPFYFLNP